MKIAPLLLIPVSSLETASTTAALLSAVGHRNVTHMENLIQGLADESIQNPSWKLDGDIKSALDKIREVFVGSIQASIKDAHKIEQESHNCGTKSCFGACNHEYTNSVAKSCNSMDTEITDWEVKHDECRTEVYDSYKTMAISCAKLDCWCLPPDPCPYEECLCQGVDNCHHATGAKKECVARTSSGDCAGQFGKWLQRMVTKYEAAYKEWSSLHEDCKTKYSHFLSVDLKCDKIQRHFEASKCGQHRCSETVCNVEFQTCVEQCWTQYNAHVKDIQCTEKDRKIDWSATKKIECYLDVLLTNYDEQLDLLKNCGTDKETCISQRRTEDYEACHHICKEVDHDADSWPKVESLGEGHCKIHGPANRTHLDEYHLGDTSYECDKNGDVVFTDHRSTRAEEDRCTEHLDIDFQVPQVRRCSDPPPPICDGPFHCKYYAKYDGLKQVSCITPHLCPAMTKGYGGSDDGECNCVHHGGEGCHHAVDQQVCDLATGELVWAEVYEHSEAWAYNRCPCQDCIGGYPEYNPPYQPECSGVHTPEIRDVSHGDY